MYSITIETSFSALHRLRLADGSWEPLHGHDWQVRATFARTTLNEAGMVLDFHEAQHMLRSIVSVLHHANLNEHAAFSGLNPTAENVARWVFDQLLVRRSIDIRTVSVMEAPGCTAIYEAGE